MDKETTKQVEKIALDVVKKYNKSFSFTERKVTDTPTDAFSLVNRRFATLSSNVGARPVSSVAIVGQHFFATDTFIPMVYSAAGWRNGVGSIVAQNN
mgnify:CR=1 FL=1